jgi:penicillin amidase
VLDFAHMQTDSVSGFARHMLPLLLARPVHGLPGSRSARALTLLGSWNGDMARDRPEPLIFNAWMQRFVADTIERDHLGGATDSWEDLADLLLAPAGASWCGGDCTPFLAASLDRSMHELAAAHGNDPSVWRWDSVHHAVFENAFLRALPVLRSIARADVPVAGDDTTLLRSGSGILGDFAAEHGAAYRGAYDLADPEHSRFIVTPGQSGNWLSSNAWNLMRTWADGTTISIGRTPRRVVATLSLLP